MSNQEPLARYIASDVSSARLARLWRAVSSRLGSRPARRGSWYGRAAALCAIAMVLGFGWRQIPWVETSSRSPLQDAFFSSSGDTLTLDLQDGSRLTLSAQTRIRVAESRADSVALHLTRGRVDCDVVVNRSRRFTISVAGVEVRVTGTRFSVALSPSGDRVTVDVSEGSVEVRSQRAGLPRALTAGEQWSVQIPSEARVVAPAKAPAPAALGETEPDALQDSQQGDRDAAAGSGPPSRGDGKVRSEGTAATPGIEANRSGDLFDKANAARREGRIAAAATLYEQLLARYPRDARAGLSAFELGRLRMDRLGNLRGATAALEQAATLARDPGIREDAIARLVRAYDALGALESCRKTQSAYQRAFPSGIHRVAVAAQCRGQTVP